VIRATRLAVVLWLLVPAAHTAALRLIERNGERVTERIVVEVRVPRDGVVTFVPDLIFRGGFER
jgi:hypothetical protein